MISLEPRQARQAARLLAGARTALGVVAYVAPAVPGRPWIGADADRTGGRVLARALGARDVALGVGLLLAERREDPIRGWVEAGGLADAGDVLATLLSWGRLPKWGRWLVLAAAGGGAVAARVVAAGCD